jgi:beta-N-acetylhexosaminidase
MKRSWYLLSLIAASPVLLFLYAFVEKEPEDAMLANAVELVEQIKSHKLADKIIIGFHGTTKDDPGVQKICDQLKTGLVGGVILFNYNIISPAQTKQLISDLKAAAGKKDIWVAVDQEGGYVQRLKAKNGFTDYLSPHRIAENMTPDQAYDHYLLLAKELAELGFNLNFGCVLDMHSDKSSIIGGLNRSYGSDPQKIAAYGEAFVKAHRDVGMTACLKHYPGHGLAKEDSHAGLVDITDSRLDIEREPFRIMIKKGMADMIMTAHLVDRKSDAKHPISLSQAVLNKWLRQEDGFKGLIVTDDLHMGAIGHHYKLEDAIVKALDAGSDLIIISNNRSASPRSKPVEVARNMLRSMRTLYVKVVNC